MSRINTDYDEWGDFPELDNGRWERNSRAVLTSKRGQKLLREIESALLALPEPKLSYVTFLKVERDDDGRTELKCCVLGAVAHSRKIDTPDYLNSEDGYAEEASMWAAQHLDMTFTMAWNLIYENDEKCGEDVSDEERFNHVLEFVRKHIRHESVTESARVEEGVTAYE